MDLRGREGPYKSLNVRDIFKAMRGNNNIFKSIQNLTAIQYREARPGGLWSCIFILVISCTEARDGGGSPGRSQSKVLYSYQGEKNVQLFVNQQLLKNILKIILMWQKQTKHSRLVRQNQISPLVFCSLLHIIQQIKKIVTRAQTDLVELSGPNNDLKLIITSFKESVGHPVFIIFYILLYIGKRLDMTLHHSETVGGLFI